MGKCELFLFMLKIILLRHKVGLCLHGHICVFFFYYLLGNIQPKLYTFSSEMYSASGYTKSRDMVLRPFIDDS